jgi:uncharacterized membrane protein
LKPQTVKYVAYALILGVIVISYYPLLSESMYSSSFSEIALVGSSGIIGEYEHQVPLGRELPFKVYISNHEEHTLLYKVVVKLVDNATALSGSPPFPVEPIASFLAVVKVGGNSTINVNPIITHEFNGKLVVELYIYDSASSSYIFHDRWVAVWLRTIK